MYVDGAFLDIDIAAPDAVEELFPGIDPIGWVMKNSSMRYSVGPSTTGLSPAVTRCATGSSRKPSMSTISPPTAGSTRRSTAWMRAISSRVENGLVT